MTRPQLTARARLTWLYTGLFATGGAVVVALTYALVASNLKVPSAGGPVARTNAPVGKCNDGLKFGFVSPDLKSKCAAVFQQGVKLGAQNQRTTTLHHLLIYSSLALVIVTGLAALAGWMLAGRVLRPVHQLTAAARAATEQNLSQRLALGGPRDELRELADTFDDMLARLETAFACQRSFIANASHELRTPLTVMRTTIDVVLAKAAPTVAELTEMGTEIRRAVDDADALIDALLTLARNEGGLGTHEPVDLATVAEDVLDSTPANRIEISAHLDRATTRGDPVLLERLVANLIENALRYNCPGGAVAVTTATTDQSALLRITNTGPRVDPGIVASLFQPFRRADERTSHQGNGLGLALVESIATLHQGTVVATAPSTGGLDITVTVASDSISSDPPVHARR